MGGAVVLLGALGAQNPVWFIFTFAIATFGLIVAFPEVSLVAVLFTKPLIDVFWFLKATGPFGVEYNLQSVVGVAVSFGFGTALLVRRWKPQLTILNVIAVIYAMITLIGLIRAPEKQQAVQDALRFISPLFLFCAAQYAAERKVNLLLIAFALSVYSFVPLCMALGQSAGLLTPPEQSVASTESLLRVTGIYHHPLDIGWRASAALPFGALVARELTSGSSAMTMWYWTSVSAIVAVCSFVRSAILVTGAQLFVMLWQNKRRTFALAALPLGMFLLLLLPPVRTAINDAVRPLAEGKVYEVGTGRAMLFVAQVRAFADATVSQKVLGRGIHSSASVSNDYSPVPSVALGLTETVEGNMGAHNQFLRAVTETGVIGLLCTVAIFLAAFGMFHERGREDALEGRFARASQTLVVGIAVYALVGQPLDFPVLSWPLWVCLGLCQRVRSDSAGSLCK